MSAAFQAVHLVMVAIYLVMLAILTLYGMYRYVQIVVYYRHQHNAHVPAGKFAELPPITVQLPMYNEMYVAQRVIEGACRIDWPRDKMQIQVLDDSTDETAAEIARGCCDKMRRQGYTIQYIHRTNRMGYKAGALAAAMPEVTGEFIVIFDADFVPTRDMVRRCIDHFTDPAVGCVQTRWDHMNRSQSMLTRSQAIFLDGHFMVEHISRNRSGRFINFNGTAGIWRRKTIDDAGGWQHDTLTEDMDLSFRAQLRGWQFVYRPDVLAPAELPPEMTSFKQQQHRWTKGQVQTAVKLLPSILQAPLPWYVKLEAVFQMTCTIAYIPAILLSLVLFPVWDMNPELFNTPGVVIPLAVASFFGVLTCSAGTFYMLSQKAAGRSTFTTMLMVPLLMALGMGIAVINSVAVLEGLFGRRDTEFVRTPKYGTASGTKDWKKRAGAFQVKRSVVPVVEIIFGVYMAACAALAIGMGSATGTVPFLVIFAFGYLYVGVLTVHNRWLAGRAGKVQAQLQEKASAVAAAA
jgi:cellulose synthase/poly-beta-1,6-N-acetylglucosamine synthase-like glycosyltransferase